MGKTGKRRPSVLGVVPYVGLLSVCGCGNFFVPPSQTGTGGNGGNVSTANLVYVANATTATVSAYAVGTNTITAVNGSPFGLGYAPQTMVVSRANNFLYVGGPGAIYAYGIGSDGSLVAPAAGAAAAAATVLSMDVSPDGNWLVALDATATTLDLWQINQTTGALTSAAGATYTVTNAVVQPRMVRFSPDGTLIFAALGTGGDVDFTFNTSNGTAMVSQSLTLGSTQISDNAVLVNPASSILYIARSGTSSGIAAYSISAGGVLNAVAGSPFAAGASPYALAFDSTGATIYAANRTDPGTISAFTVAAGPALTAVSGSPFTSGSLVTSLALDRTGKYLFAAANNGSPDLTMYGLDAAVPGKLNSITSVSTGVDPTGPILVTATH